jgi:hypothetical protein
MRRLTLLDALYQVVRLLVVDVLLLPLAAAAVVYCSTVVLMLANYQFVATTYTTLAT